MITDPQQALRVGANGTLISKAILVIVVIALIVGAISVTNTMAMSIMERQSELGLLSTVGWSPVRVASLILGEGVAVSVLGAAAGLLFGVIGGGLLVHALGVSAYVSPSVTAWGWDGPAGGRRDRRARRHLPRVAGDPHDAAEGAVGHLSQARVLARISRRRRASRRLPRACPHLRAGRSAGTRAACVARR